MGDGTIVKMDWRGPKSVWYLDLSAEGFQAPHALQRENGSIDALPAVVASSLYSMDYKIAWSGL